MGAFLDERRKQAKSTLQRLIARLERGDQLTGDGACIYVTGSFGRGEASRHSDLDLFIVGRMNGRKRALSRLNEIRIKSDLIDACEDLEMPEFSGDGEYLAHYTVEELIGTLGQPHDDATNTFTARLLLLLESRPLFGRAFYGDVIRQVIDAYWRDFEDHRRDFVPAFLANDILRLWRTFCVNYEARTQTDPPERKAKRKLKNYKLKHSRLLTCYSALAYLLFLHREHSTVTPANARRMVRLSPTERLEWIEARARSRVVRAKTRALMDAYDEFLRATDAPEKELIERFLKPPQARRYWTQAKRFGDLMGDLLSLAPGSFFRTLLV